MQRAFKRGESISIVSLAHLTSAVMFSFIRRAGKTIFLLVFLQWCIRVSEELASMVGTNDSPCVTIKLESVHTPWLCM